MLKITIKKKGEPRKTYTYPNKSLIIDWTGPDLVTNIQASWNDKVNKSENKTMQDLCQDVAEILKNEFGFKILREEQPRFDSNGSRVVTEGSPSDNKDSLSLYYYVRYDLSLSDSMFSDGIDFGSDIEGSAVTDLILRISNHMLIFNSTGDHNTRSYDSKKLSDLAVQEGSEPTFVDNSRHQIKISDKVKHAYTEGLQEISDKILDFIGTIRNTIRLKFGK